MSATFNLTYGDQHAALSFAGDWTINTAPPLFSAIAEQLARQSFSVLMLNTEQLNRWDALFVSRLYQCARWCADQHIELKTDTLPEKIQRLLSVATAVPPAVPPPSLPASWHSSLNPLPKLKSLQQTVSGQMQFIGEIVISCGRLISGRANVQLYDFLYFIERTGPNALAIVGLISVLVGMILAYLGAVQLALFGAEVYVANLVTVGTLREMGALMTAIIMAGRTGAAYAAQLGTMQVNEEIDAITTLGIKPVEFLVLPRLIALLITMPLLCIYADILSIVGGIVVALGMDVTIVQFMHQARESADITTVMIGIGKSLVFAVVIALAGCKAGMECGRNSAAVGEATTRAVVNAIVWLVISDAIINISLSNFGI